MKKLLFIVPMHITFESFMNPAHNSRSFKKKNGQYYNSLSTDLPLGPISMSAYLKKFMDIEVKLLDFNAEINLLDDFPYANFYECCRDLVQRLDFSPDIVGISSLFSPSFFNFMDCGKVARELFPEALVIGGGNIPTNSYKHIFNDLGCDFFDGLCFGEGEKPLLGLLQADDAKAYMQSSSAWITAAKVAPTAELFLPKHDFIEDLDEIPFFDYDLCNIEKHATNPVTSSFHSVENQKGFHIMTSRGCPYLCTFCASHRTHGRKMRLHSVERVQEDLNRLSRDYGATTVVFQDDHLMSDKDRVYDILRIVGELKLEALFQNGLTLYALDRPMLEAFYAAGVRHLVLPVESGSEKVLKEQMKKPLKFRISERVAQDCRDIGIYTNTNILIGMPGETKADLEEARINLRKVKTNWFNIACASPIVGSDMHNLAVEKGYIKFDTLGSDYRKAVIQTEDFTPEFIQETQYLMNLELNFVHNNDVALGEFETALKAFKNVIRIKPDHAFAYYFAAQCYQGMGDQEACESHMAAYHEHAAQPFWQKYVEHFQLPATLQALAQ
jgi:anaerobic magnesium-protoporphyrin IX monomethyl ester cyclase